MALDDEVGCLTTRCLMTRDKGISEMNKYALRLRAPSMGG